MKITDRITENAGTDTIEWDAPTMHLENTKQEHSKAAWEMIRLYQEFTLILKDKVILFPIFFYFFS